MEHATRADVRGDSIAPPSRVIHAIAIVIAVLAFASYPLTYAALRASHRLVNYGYGDIGRGGFHDEMATFYSTCSVGTCRGSAPQMGTTFVELAFAPLRFAEGIARRATGR